MVMVIPDAAPDAPPDAFEPIFDFSCMGNAQGNVSTNVQLSGFVGEVVVNGMAPGLAPAFDATVEVCKAASDACTDMDQLDTKTMPTMAMGCPATGCVYTSGNLTTGGEALDIYVKSTKGTDRPTYVYPSSPVISNVSNIPAVMFTPEVIAALQLFNINQSPTKAMMLIRVTDCMDASITDTPNVTITLEQNNQPVQGTTLIDVGEVLGAFDPMLAATFAGTFMIINVPVGGTAQDPAPTITEVSAMYKTKALRAHEVKVFPGGTTGTQLRPGF
jgi:hypothetical protein